MLDPPQITILQAFSKSISSLWKHLSILRNDQRLILLPEMERRDQ